MIRPAYLAIVSALRNLLHVVQMVILSSIRDLLAVFTMRETAFSALAERVIVNHCIPLTRMIYSASAPSSIIRRAP